MATISFAAPSKFRKTGVGELLPLVQDLATEVQPESKFKASTYQIDEDALRKRLGEYNMYDLGQFGDLADYFKSKAPLVQGNIAYFKPSDLQQAQLTIPAQALPADVTYSDRPGQKFYQSIDLPQPIAQTSPEPQQDLSRLDQLRNFGYSDGSPEPEADFDQYFGPKVETINVGGRTYQIETPAGLSGIFGDINKYNTKLYELSPEGALQQVYGNRTQPVSLQMATAVRDPRLKEWLAKDDPTTSADDLIREIWGSDPTGALMLYGQQAARKEGGPDRTPDTFAFSDQAYWPAVYGGMQWDLSPAIGEAVKKLNLHTPQSQAASQQWGSVMSPSAQSARNDPGGDGIGIDTIVSTALKFTPLAPVAYAYDAYNAIKNKNWLGLGMTALGGLGQLSGFNPAQSIGSGISSGLGLDLSKAAQTALGGGLMGAGLGAIKGGTTDALMGGLSGGIGGYLGASGASPLTRIAADTGLGALGSSLYGGDVGKGALSGLIGSTINTGLGELGRQMGQAGYSNAYKIGAGITSPLIRQMLTKQLYKV